MTLYARKPGNIFGSARAENDTLLDSTFIETAEFKNLAHTDDFHLAVGRRGTGKSAVFLKLRDAFRSRATLLIESTGEEHSSIAVNAALQRLSHKYEHARAITKLLWKSAILTHIAGDIVLRRNAHLRNEDDWLGVHLATWGIQHRPSVYSTVAAMLRDASTETFPAAVAHVADHGKISELREFVASWLTEHDKKAVVLLDRLDEGWAADATSTGVLGGLSAAAVELAEAFCPIHVLVFVRDNMFRALAHYDPDFSRNIEDASLRLKWTENSLFTLITTRIRKALNIGDEKDIRIWDRFAQNELKGQAGFREVLKHTLYRPRDLLILLNKAYQNACGAGREHIVHADIEQAALEISQARLDDLVKEYDQVLPGTAEFTLAFRGAASPMRYEDALELLDACAASDMNNAAHSMAVLGSAADVFAALHGIGFLGIKTDSGEYEFCHDGTQGTAKELKSAHSIGIHPCYSRALALVTSDLSVEVAASINDEEPTPEAKGLLQDQRSRQLGKVLVEYEQIEPGEQHAYQFEVWLHRATKVLFSGNLINVEMHPNKASALRRDVVGTSAATSGFWKRLHDDYQCRQVVFEAKNYSELGPSEFNQAVSYGGGAYGKASFIVHRGTAGLDSNERAHIKARYYGQEHLIIILPAALILQCLRKQRSNRRVDYTEDALSKLLDTYERQYLGEDAGKKRPKRRRR